MNKLIIAILLLGSTTVMAGQTYPPKPYVITDAQTGTTRYCQELNGHVVCY